MIKEFTDGMKKFAEKVRKSDDINDEFEARMDGISDRRYDDLNIKDYNAWLLEKAGHRVIWRFAIGEDNGNDGYYYFIDDGNFVDWLQNLSDKIN